MKSFLFINLLTIIFTALRAAGETLDQPLSPMEAAATMKVPVGFSVSLFAGEPDIVQPINFCIDDRSRLWVCEAHNYPVHGTTAGDRIIILEDTDHDGRHDKRTIFYEGLNYVTGIEVGFGGAWVMSPPYFYFIPDKNKDDIPDTAPELVLDGFGNHSNSHNLANGFAWGPDGWLYGTHGRTNWSKIGKPGSPEKDRKVFDGGVWRFHPVTKKWEPFCDGTTNPWGIDWDESGEAFITNCVNPHLFHAIQGAHYEPWRGRESSRFAYRRINTIADHVHYVSGQGLRDNLGSEEVLNLGGGHAHCGSMIYRGGAFPTRYHGTIFMNNIHGKRINNDILTPSGSGYTASHGADFAISKDPWFMGVTLQYGPDGSVFASDWSDTGECHSVRNTRKETGRIYKISYLNHGGEKSSRIPLRIDVSSLSDRELVSLLTHKNQWWVRHARRNLQERAAAGVNLGDALATMDATAPNQRLEALWTRHVTGTISDPELLELLDDDSAPIRSWAIRLLAEDGLLTPDQLKTIELTATRDVSPAVRLSITSALQRIPPEQRWGALKILSEKEEDANDQNLPLMVWYALEPLIDTDIQRFSAFAREARIPVIREHVARRIAEHPVGRSQLSILTSHLPMVDSAVASDILEGLLEGLKGSKNLPKPPEWDEGYRKLIDCQSEVVRRKATELALIFGDPNAAVFLKKQIADAANSPENRNRCLQSLIDSPTADTGAYLITLLGDASINQTAIRGLAKFSGFHDTLLNQYTSFSTSARQDILQTLAARVDSANALLDRIESGNIPKGDLNAFTARQISSLHVNLAGRIRKSWGELRTPEKAKRQLIESYLKELKPEAIAAADPAAGRGHFQMLCAGCHQMFGEGGKIGPELTGSQRTNLEYLLENIIDPSAAVSKDYQMNIIRLKSGQTLSGFISSQADETLTIQSINEQVVVRKTEIAEQTQSPLSIMPEGLLQILPKEKVRELIAYLSSPHQVALPLPPQ